MERIYVNMSPHPDDLRGKEHSGIAQVVLNWARHLPEYGIEVVAPNAPAMISIGHSVADVEADIHVSHGLLWTEEMKLGRYAYEVNEGLVRAATYARAVIVPSQWVADVYRRDLRMDVHVIGHGINPDEWEHEFPLGGYVLYTKNRTKDGLDPSQINDVALQLPRIKFYTTFATRDSPPNVITYGGTVPFAEMKRHIQEAGVVFMPDRETWGITAAEAMAAKVPVLSTSAGAVKEFVKHGQTGYIYNHQNLADAVQGAKYCLTHGTVLGDNGQQRARGYLDWRISVKKVADVIKQVHSDMVEERKLVGVDELNTVAVVITSHNYAHLADRAIDSVLAQTHKPTHIIVVDDSSKDNIEEVVKGYADSEIPIHYRRVDASNVALARNEGIYNTHCRFVVMLDGDDWLRPDFIRDCLQPLIKDKLVGFTYSGTEVVLDETGEILMPPELAEATGKRAHRPWPTMDYDKQFMVGKANQFPATAMFRRKALLRVGGYRARYAPRGAGTEDANLYLRLLTHGWPGVMVKPTVDNLWVHTHGRGHVSGAEDFVPVNWRIWRPETQDYKFPFAAKATPKNLSHPVRSYEPKVSVIIPVGPGHELNLITALDSVEAQLNRNWEAIVVWDFEPSPPTLQYFRVAYPHVRWAKSYSTGYQEPYGAISNGAGYARNVGVEHSQAEFITFLDADDYYSPEFLTHLNKKAALKHRAVLYSQYYSRMSKAMHPGLGGDIVVDEGDSLVADYSFHDYDRARARQRPGGDRPYVWSAINILLPRAWHDAVGGFDEELSTWEDCLYLLSLAWHGYDFHRIEEQLWVYSFTDGTRRAKSAGKEDELMAHFQLKYDEIRAMHETSAPRSKVHAL